MKVGQIVKLNPEIFPVDKRNEKLFQAGKLAYPVFFLEMDFKVEDIFEDESFGEMLKLSCKEYERPINFIAEDCIIKE